MRIIIPVGKPQLICDSLTMMHRGVFLYDFVCEEQKNVEFKHHFTNSFCRIHHVEWDRQRKKLVAK